MVVNIDRMVLTRAECAVVTFLVTIQRAGGDAVNESEASGAGDHAEARGLPFFCVGASSRREINPLAVLLTSGMTRGIVLHTETGKCDKWDASQGNPPQHPKSRDKKKRFLSWSRGIKENMEPRTIENYTTKTTKSRRPQKTTYPSSE